jgi:hypothetical protein
MLNMEVAHCLPEREREKPPSLPIRNDRLLICCIWKLQNITHEKGHNMKIKMWPLIPFIANYSIMQFEHQIRATLN